MGFDTVTWKNGRVVMIDQTLLPHEVVYHEYDSPEEVARAIERMIVRGAPAIGVTAALGLALAASESETAPIEKARTEFSRWAERFAKTRPTAVNLFWAIDRMKSVAGQAFPDSRKWAEALRAEALSIHRRDVEACRRMGELGAALVPDRARILTHCNAGALATAGWGTALGVIRSAHAAKKEISVWVDETRPFLQGSRLTAWELQQEKIPATLITDNMAGSIMASGQVDLVIVGADRIAANGDVVNKIGTYPLAILAQAHKIPFYVAAPLSTFDFTCRSGKEIPIEERDPEEVRSFGGKRVAPENFPARHPAFDVTPARLVTAIIAETGIARAPYENSLKNLETTR